MADRLAIAAHQSAFGAKVAVGVDLQLGAAIAENALRHHGHHVHAVNFAGDNEGGGFVVRVCGPGTNGRHETLRRIEHVAVPLGIGGQKRHHRAVGTGFFQDHQRINAGQIAAHVGVTVASARLALGDVAHDRAGIAADLAVGRCSPGFGHCHRLPCMAARTRSGVAGKSRIKTPVA